MSYYLKLGLDKGVLWAYTVSMENKESNREELASQNEQIIALGFKQFNQYSFIETARTGAEVRFDTDNKGREKIVFETLDSEERKRNFRSFKSLIKFLKARGEGK